MSASNANIVRKATSISGSLPEDDQQENLRVIREAKHATHKIYDQDQNQSISSTRRDFTDAAAVSDLMRLTATRADKHPFCHVRELLVRSD